MKRVEPKIMDTAYVDRELEKLFDSVHWGKNDQLIIKYRSRFLRQRMERKNPDSVPDKNGILSLGKKLEILCLYGDYKLVKMDKKSKVGHNVANNSDNKDVKTKVQGI